MSVTIITALVYLAIVIPLIVIQETVPKAPADPVLYHGLNTTEAWLDLATLTNGYHPYNSRRNDEVRNWLLIRIEEILRANGIEFATASQVSPQTSSKRGAAHSHDRFRQDQTVFSLILTPPRPGT
jgi:hypothetical protein